jgi:hypothetical protein
MRNPIFIVLILGLLFLQSCSNDTCELTTTYDVYTPEYLLPDSLSQEITIESPRALKAPGKIYFYKNYIFINEPYDGFHMINNTNPSAPINERFIGLVGNVDLAIMNDYLYADAYVDLVTIDLRDIQNIKQVSRKKGIFDSQYHKGNDGKILTRYVAKKETQTIDCSSNYYGLPYFFRDGFLIVDANAFDVKGESGGIAPGQVGQGGSMARFTISKSHLYAVGNAELYALTIQENGQINDPIKIQLPWGIETIFPYQDYLFIGANNGVHLVSIENPSAPVVKSKFDHARSCDPVVVQDDVAFVTLRNGTTCQGYINQLDIIDVKDVTAPKLLHTFDMVHPHGLSVDGQYLYLCEGKSGLKVFDIKDLSSIKKNEIGHYDGFHAWDVISIRDHSLLVIGEDGFRQYDHSDPKKLKLISTIPVVK